MDQLIGETLSETALEQGKPLGAGNSLAVGQKPKEKYQGHIPPSKQPLDRKAYEKFKSQPIEKKREYLKQQWLGIGYLLLGKADLLAQSLSKKDYGRMVQLLTSAGIAWDKVFPKVDQVQGNNLVLNLFNGLPRDKVLQVIGQGDLPTEKPLVSPPDSNTTQG